MKVRTRFVVVISVLLLAPLIAIVLLRWKENRDVVRALDSATSVTLYSVQPVPYGGTALPQWDFHGYHLIGHIELGQDKAKQAIHEFKNLSVQSNVLLSGQLKCLFSPRHALRVISDGHTYDLLMCYQCGQLQIFRDQQPIAFFRAKGSPEVLNGLLTAAGIPLADSHAADHSYDEEAKQTLQMAEQGNPEAQERISRMYSSGLGVKQDNAESIKWLRKAAEQGRVDDLVNLGSNYEIGNRVAKDKTEALKWYRMAAERGSSDGDLNIGSMYEHGDGGLKQDYTEAMKWYLRAADHGNIVAKDVIGDMYKDGRGVKQDRVEAYFWYSVAGNVTDPRLEQQVSWQQKAAVAIRVLEWKLTPAPAEATSKPETK